LGKEAGENNAGLFRHERRAIIRERSEKRKGEKVHLYQPYCIRDRASNREYRRILVLSPDESVTDQKTDQEDLGHGKKTGITTLITRFTSNTLQGFSKR